MRLTIKTVSVAGILMVVSAVGVYTSKAATGADQAKSVIQHHQSSGQGAAEDSRRGENDGLACPRTGITLAQAAMAAEERVNGRAVRAGLEHRGQGWVYAVETVANNMVYEIVIDPAKGTVISATADKGDHGEHEGHHGERDDDDGEES